jgi:hypothetical protein
MSDPDPSRSAVTPPTRPAPAPEPAFFDNAAIDHLITAVLELGAELWVQRERVRVIERLLATHGVVTAAAIEHYRPDEAEIASARAERQAFIDRIYGAFARTTVRATPGAE